MDIQELRKRKLVTDEIIVARYVSGRSINQVAEDLNVGRKRVHNALLRTKTPRRERIEGIRLAKRQDVPLSERTRSLLDGLLLSDGHLTSNRHEGGRGESCFILRQCEAHEQWVLAVQKVLKGEGVRSVLGRQKGGKHFHRVLQHYINASPSLRLRSQSSNTFSVERQRWYPAGLKRVPRDLIFTDEVLACWFLGDGHNDGRGLKLCTHNFPRKEVEWLGQELQRMYGYTTAIHADRRLYDGKRKVYWLLYLRYAEDVRDFVKRVRPFTPKCFEYKLKLRTTRKTKSYRDWLF